MRVCTTCKVDLPLDAFGNDPRGKFGKKDKCKKCICKIEAEKYGEKKKLYYAKRWVSIRDKAREEAGWIRPDLRQSAVCSRCNEMKGREEFKKESRYLSGIGTMCKACSRVAASTWYYQNKQRALEACKRWKKRNPEKISAYWKEALKREKLDPRKRLIRSFRSRLKGSKIASGSTAAYEALGYSAGELRVHLERQFVGEMSWDNYGQWHIDHIVPIASFEFSSVEDPGFIRAWALTNLRPLWAIDNLKKSSKVEFLV